MAQMAGATAMKYYLPTLFRALGLGTRLALMASAIEMTLKVGCTALEMLIIDRLGRKFTLIAGCVIMAVGMLVSADPVSRGDGDYARMMVGVMVGASRD